MLSKLVTSKGFVMFATFEFPFKTAKAESLINQLKLTDIPYTPKSASRKRPINGATTGYFVFTPYRSLPQIGR